MEFDSIEHSLYSCSEIVQTLTTFFQFLKVECEINVNFGMVQYLMGFSGNENVGLNHVLLEFKKAISYSWDSNKDSDAFSEQVKYNIKRIMLKEKQNLTESYQYELYNLKWKKFVSIYDFRGPDIQF